MDSSNVRPKGRRFSSGLPTHLKIDASNHAYQNSSKPAYATSSEGARRRQWLSTSELASSVLISLSYTLTSITYELSTMSRPSTIDGESNALGGQASQGITLSHQLPLRFGPDMLATCALTSGVLLSVGGTAKLREWFGGELEIKPSVMGHRRTGSIQTDVMTVGGARKMLSSSFSVGLPIYASFKLGGVQTCLIILTAIVADLMSLDEPSNSTNKGSWKRLWKSRPWTIAALLLQSICDMALRSSTTGQIGRFSGFLALCLSVFVLPPPFPVHTSKKQHNTSPTAPPPSSGPSVLTTLKEIPASSSTVLPDRKVSLLTRNTDDIDLTLVAGISLGFVATAMFFFSSITSAGTFSTAVVGSGALTISVAALLLMFLQPQSLLQSRGLGALFGSLLSCSLLIILGQMPWINSAYQVAFILLCSAATIKDTHSSHTSHSSSHHTHGHGHGHSHHDHSSHHTEHHENPSRVSQYLLNYSQKWPLLHSILSEKDSRRIFYFMILNFAFMLVQTFYGIATGSLGLLSDSIHMFFDCLALVVGLCAAVMSKWPPSTRFPYGFGKMDTLAGFANGIFLMLISVEIVYEAIERLAEGSEMQRLGELLTVSALGLMVNLVGMTAFGHAHHGHGHSHGGHDHSHDHGHTPTAHDRSHDHSSHAHEDECHDHHDHHDHDNHDKHDHTHLHDHLHASTHSSVPATPSKPIHAHSHAHGHHHHGNENMHGIFLHILADTMGSVAVILSTLLIHFYGWSGFDPIASVIIAVLIFASAIPLVKSSATTLLLTIPEDTEFDLREALAGVSALRGVIGYAVPKFWLEEGEEKRVLGVIHVFAGKNADMEDIKERAVAFLKTRGMNVLVQVEREGSGRCWCRGGLRAS